MSTLNRNVTQTIADFDEIKLAVEDMGVEVPDGTSTSEYSQKIREIEKGITPSGALEITENGNYDVTEYAEAEVSIPQPGGKITITENMTDVDISQYAVADIDVPQGVFPEGTLQITENSNNINVSQYELVDVNVPQGIFPEGTINITENGSHDVSSYESANVNVVSMDDYLEGSIVNYTGHATTVVQSAFRGYESLESVDLPDVKSVYRYGFADCTNLKSVRLESCTYLHTDVFLECSNLESVYMPELVEAGSQVSFGQSGNFTYCTKLKSIDFPKLQVVGVYEFRNTGIETVNLPEATAIASDAFANCQSLVYIKLPKAQTFNSNVFGGCTALERVELPAVTRLGGTAFTGCTALTALILGTRLPYPGTEGTPYSPSFDLPNQTIIYVKNADLDWYASDNNWSTLYNAERIKSIDELPPLESDSSLE